MVCNHKKIILTLWRSFDLQMTSKWPSWPSKWKFLKLYRVTYQMKANDTSILPEDVLDHLEVIWPPNDLHDLQNEDFLNYIEWHIKWKIIWMNGVQGNIFWRYNKFQLKKSFLIMVSGKSIQFRKIESSLFKLLGYRLSWIGNRNMSDNLLD